MFFSTVNQHLLWIEEGNLWIVKYNYLYSEAYGEFTIMGGNVHNKGRAISAPLQKSMRR